MGRYRSLSTSWTLIMYYPFLRAIHLFRRSNFSCLSCFEMVPMLVPASTLEDFSSPYVLLIKLKFCVRSTLKTPLHYLLIRYAMPEHSSDRIGKDYLLSLSFRSSARRLGMSMQFRLIFVLIVIARCPNLCLSFYSTLHSHNFIDTIALLHPILGRISYYPTTAHSFTLSTLLTLTYRAAINQTTFYSPISEHIASTGSYTSDMFRLTSPLALILAASSISASPLLFIPPLINTDINLGTIQLGTRVLV